MTTLDQWIEEQRADNLLWPWPDDGEGVRWPLRSDAPRQERYTRNEKAADGDHWAIFEAGNYHTQSEEDAAKTNYVAVNYVAVAMREVIRIFSESELDVPPGAPEEIAKANDLNQLVRDLMRDRMRLGDGALLVRTAGDPPVVKIELLDPAITYVITRPDSRKDIEEIRVCYPSQQGDQSYVHIVQHQVGRIVHTLWHVNKSRLERVAFGEVPYVKALVGASDEDTEVAIETGMDLLTVVWSPRQPHGDVEGDSLCHDALVAQKLLNRRESQRNGKLTAMDDPLMIVGDGDTEPELHSTSGAPTGRRVFRMSSSRVIVRQPGDEGLPPPSWLTADPNLDANEQAQDDHRRAFAMQAGIAVSSITQDTNAQAAPSGESLREQFRPTVLTAEEEARDACEAIATAIRAALWWSTGSDPGDLEVSLPTSEAYAETMLPTLTLDSVAAQPQDNAGNPLDEPLPF